jgi:hypothetical protein
MFELDDQFLQDAGLGAMDQAKKDAFLKHTKEELEMRIGFKMSDGLSDQQITDFENVIAGDKATIEKVVEGVDLEDDPLYQELAEKTGFKVGSNGLRNEYASVKWLNDNRPDYRDIVQGEVDNLKAEILANKDKIL